MDENRLLVLDFGARQGRSIARKVRGEQVYCEVLPCDAPIERILERRPKGLLLVGGAFDADAPGAPDCDRRVFDLDVPILGMGYGARILLKHLGGQRVKALIKGQTAQVQFEDSPLFAGLTESERYFERLDEQVLPEGAQAIAHTPEGAPVAFCAGNRFGIQFHVEQNDPDGFAILRNFAQGICGCAPTWNLSEFIDGAVEKIRAQVGEGRALVAISGGVDSAVCAALMHKAIGDDLYCLHVDTGLMRKGEIELVKRLFREQMGVALHLVDASERFLSRLTGIRDAREKRRIIAEEFLHIFEEEAAKAGIETLVQGTNYNDVLDQQPTALGARRPPEAGQAGFAALIEPVRPLFKEEVRQVAEMLGLPGELVNRQAFPGAGLAVRCMGEVSERKLLMLRKADAIYCEAIAQAGLDRRISQYFAVLTDVQTRGSLEGAPTKGYTVALRAVNHSGDMSAGAYRLPYDLLERVVMRITTEVEGVNRVVYDVTGKPPATIEWE